MSKSMSNHLVVAHLYLAGTHWRMYKNTLLMGGYVMSNPRIGSPEWLKSLSVEIMYITWRLHSILSLLKC